MSLILDGTNGLTFNNATTQASAGKVLQVVQGTLQSSFSTTSTSPVSTGLTASITPKFSTSKILVRIVANGVRANNTTYNTSLFGYRGATNITGSGSSAWTYFTGGTQTNGRVASIVMEILDSPATTSSTAYALYMATEDASSTAFLSNQSTNNPLCTITLMEIAA